ncbi:MAG: CrcB protein [Cellvibrionaceae bacterium]|jgi:CrcB protein
MQNLIAIGAGGAIGALLRYGIATATHSFIPLENGFPLGTFIANMLGAFLMGILYQTFNQSAAHNELLRLLLTTGMLGALTTFSTFALEGVNLYRVGNSSMAVTYIVLSNLFGLLILFAGITLVSRLS